MLVPGVNWMMLVIMNVELSESFGRRRFTDLLMAVVLPFIHFPRLAFDNGVTYTGPKDWKGRKKPFWLGWRNALAFASIAATTLNILTFQSYSIPTPSMEGGWMTGDYLFVSKVNYGPRLPSTQLGLPFMSNRIPGTMTPSYSNLFSLPYWRLPGFGKVEHNDPMVFNFPANDTFLLDEELSGHTYAQLVRNTAWEMSGRSEDFQNNKGTYLQASREYLENEYGVSTRPADRREHYVKRCVGLPGDELQIVNRQVLINGEAKDNPAELQYRHFFEISAPFEAAILKDRYDIDSHDMHYFAHNGTNYCAIHMREDQAALLAQAPNVSAMQVQDFPSDFDYKAHPLYPQYQPIFPNHPSVQWSEDNFGPLRIPAAGLEIELSEENLVLYERAITAYEGNTLTRENGRILLNGQEADRYTFKLDYYWLMGDNRHNSVDSRYWGFVPEDHVIGKPVLVWFSLDPAGGVRWDRIFTDPD